MPWAPEFRKAGVKGITANAIDVVIETGDSGPITPVGINLPNDQKVREQHGSKSVSLVERDRGLRQVDACRSSAASSPGRPRKSTRADKWSAFAGELHTNMHEVIGHASGKVADKVERQPGDGAQGALLGARGRPRRPRRRSTSWPTRSWPSSAS